MSFNLLSVPSGHKTDIVLIVAPYFDTEFAKRIVAQLRPKRLRFIVDDGASFKDIEDLQKACAPTKVKIGLGVAPGIFHMKFFYFEFVHKTKGSRKRQLFYGSSNATNAALSGNINAELISEVDLAKRADNKLLQYIEAVLGAVEAGTKQKIDKESCDRLSRGSRLHMPAFTIAPLGLPPGMDAWLQRGRLVAKYPDPQRFLTVTLRLKSGLPAGGVVDIFARQGLVAVGNQHAVQFSYVERSAQQRPTDGQTPQWKARYCVWTHLGHWVSEDCYDRLKGKMRAKSAAERERRVDDLLTNGFSPKWREKRKAEFRSAVSAVWQQLLHSDENPSHYLEGSAKSGADFAKYDRVIEDKIKRDLVLAKDRDFRERYVQGYEFPKVPRFRQDSDAWELFVDSWFDTIALARAGSSKVASAISEALKSIELKQALTDPDKVKEALRSNWNTIGSEKESSLRNIVTKYYI